jgi:hypothetical protein
MDEARKLGFVAGVVERFNSFTKRRNDLFGFADLVLMQPGVGIVAVQATSGDHHADRKAKLLAEPRCRTWIESGGIAELWTWAKQGERGKAKRWTLRRERIALEDTVLP